jgi:hypothetical protein
VSLQEEIRAKAVELIQGNPHGVRYSELIKTLIEVFPQTSSNSISEYIQELEKQFPETIHKEKNGQYHRIWYHDTAQGEVEEHHSQPVEQPLQLKKEDYYQSFSEWLTNDLREVTKVIAFGEGLFRSNRGTPDIRGVYRPESSTLRTRSIIVTAKITLDDTSTGLTAAFNEVRTYKIFCHKVYFVIPKRSHESDISGIKSLCSNSGIGLVLFDNMNKQNPKYEIKRRAIQHPPAQWYIEDNPPLIENILFN